MKKHNKFAVTVLVLFALCFVINAENSPKTFFPALVQKPVYPIDNYIGQTASEDSSEEHAILAVALKTEYSFEWVETFVATDSKRMITNLQSTLLSQILPAKSYVFSKLYKNADDSVSISVRFFETDDIITFVFNDKKIINISCVKK